MYPHREISLLSLGGAYFLRVLLSYNSILTFLANFLAIACLSSIGWLVWTVALYPNFFSPLIGLPEPSGASWWNGHFREIAEKPSGVPQCGWVNTMKHNGLIRYRAFCNQERILIASPKALSEVLVTKSYEFIKPTSLRHSIGRILGVGVLLAEGDEHKFQRRNLLPAFGFRHIKNLYGVFWSKSCEGVLAMTTDVERQIAEKKMERPITSLDDGFVKIDTEGKEGISDDSNGDKHSEHQRYGDAGVLQVNDWASRITLDIIGVAGMGRDFGAIADPNTTLAQVYRTIFSPNKQARILGLLGIILPGWFVSNLPVSRNNDIVSARRTIRAVCHELIQAKKEKLAKHQLKDTDMLAVALQSGVFSDENLVDQVMTFLAAGHETTASALSWAIYCLCLYPDMQSKLREEVRRVLPSPSLSDAVINDVDIDKKMPYLNAIINEVLRFYPPVPLTLRVAAHDTTIQGVRIPKDTTVIFCPSATNRDESLWGQDAAKFKPERWLNAPADAKGDNNAGEGGGSRSNFAFLTFLHGPRSCIGMGFAKAEFACLLAAFVGRFEFDLKNECDRDPDKMKVGGTITARPADGLMCLVRVVEGW